MASNYNDGKFLMWFIIIFIIIIIVVILLTLVAQCLKINQKLCSVM